MRKTLSALTIVLAVGAIGLAAEARRATGSIELIDPAGDVVPIQTSNGAKPGLDIEPGQAIRILARESSSGATPTGEMRGFFPEILLTLK